jgi:SOS response regulatory protein OraA/RecX
MPEENTPNDVTVLVEFPQRPGLVQASILDMDREELAERSEEALQRAMGLISHMAHRAGELRRRIPAEFTQAEIEFGVKLDYEAGALLAKAGGEGSISVTLTWERPEKTDNS